MISQLIFDFNDIMLMHIHSFEGRAKFITVALNLKPECLVISEPDHFKMAAPIRYKFASLHLSKVHAKCIWKEPAMQCSCCSPNCIPNTRWFQIFLKLNYCNGILTALWAVKSGQLCRIPNNKTFWLLSPTI